MTILRYISIFLFLTLLGYGQVPQKPPRIELPIQAEIPVRGLYRQLVSHPIVGIPTPKRMKVLSPYLSSSLIHRINQARACRDDWFRLHPKNDEKAPSTWFEFGLFSGYNDRGDPRAFRIDKTESEDDGSFRVYMRLTEGPQEKPWNWQVAVVVMSEEGKLVINDVIFLRDKDVETESRLSELLTVGCDGSHWVGSGNKNTTP
jgi:hypothetical protein